MNKRTLNPFLWGLIFFCLFLIQGLTLKPGHNWGGDFAQYLLNSQNIRHHQPYQDGIMLQNPLVYPPGFPYLLSWIPTNPTENFIPFKCLPFAFWFLSIALMAFMYRRILSKSFLILWLLIWCTSSFFFLFKQNVLSDIPFLFFCLLAITSWHNNEKTSSKKLNLPFLLSLIAMSLSLVIRNAGICLWIASLVYLIYARQWLKLSLTIMVGALTIMISSFIMGHAPAGFINIITHNPWDYLRQVAEHSSLVWQSLTMFFFHGITPITQPLGLTIQYLVIFLSPLLFLWIFYLTFDLIRRRHLTWAHCFFITYLLCLTLWTGFNDSPDHFIRFILPLAAMLPLFLYSICKHYPEWMRLILIIILSMQIINVGLLWRFDDDDLIKSKPNQELFAWMKTHIAYDEHYIFWEPRTTALMTQRIGQTTAWLNLKSPSQWLTWLSNQNIRYLILNREYDHPLIRQLNLMPEATGIWENEFYIIFDMQSPSPSKTNSNNPNKS